MDINEQNNNELTEEDKGFERDYEVWKNAMQHHFNQISYLGGGGGIDESTDILRARQPNPPAGYYKRKGIPEPIPTKSTNEDCFIATIVYGDLNAPQVYVLRDLRDNTLSKTILGRKAIHVYYSGFGKRCACMILNYLPFTIPLIRKGLNLLVQHCEKHPGRKASFHT